MSSRRLCTLIRKDSTIGYGFNLYKKKNTVGQFIGTVEKDSLAEVAGLNEGDMLVEVNEVNVIHDSHKEVVQRIRELPNKVTLLVEGSEKVVTKQGFEMSNEIKVTKLQIADAKETNHVQPNKKQATNIQVEKKELYLPATAREMREQLEKRRKVDARKEDHGMWEKKQAMIQAL